MTTKKRQPMNRTQLACQYGVSLETMKKWLALIPELQLDATQRILTPKQVEMIINYLGEPPD